MSRDLNAIVFAVALDSHNPQILYAGTESGGVFKSVDGGQSWFEINNGLPLYSAILVLTPDPTSSGRMYAATDRGVYKTVDGGTTWREMNSGLTKRVAFALVVDPQSPNVLYVGVDGGGVYKSTDGAATWEEMNQGLTNLRVFALAIDPRSSDGIYAGTIGSGVYRLRRVVTTDITNSTVEELSTGYVLRQNSPNPFNTETRVRYQLPEDVDMELALYTLTGYRVRTLRKGNHKAGHHSIVWDGKDEVGREMGSGMYVMRLWTKDVAITRKVVLIR